MIELIQATSTCMPNYWGMPVLLSDWAVKQQIKINICATDGL